MDAAFRSAGQHPMWALVTQSSQTQGFEPLAQLLSWAAEDVATSEGSLEA